MTAFYYLLPHKLLAKKYAAVLSELRELGDAVSLHSVKEQRWAEKEAAYLSRIGDLTDDLAEAIEREDGCRSEDDARDAWCLETYAELGRLRAVEADARARGVYGPGGTA